MNASCKLCCFSAAMICPFFERGTLGRLFQYRPEIGSLVRPSLHECRAARCLALMLSLTTKSKGLCQQPMWLGDLGHFVICPAQCNCDAARLSIANRLPIDLDHRHDDPRR